jgi:hypothetical protein
MTELNLREEEAPCKGSDIRQGKRQDENFDMVCTP